LAFLLLLVSAIFCVPLVPPGAFGAEQPGNIRTLVKVFVKGFVFTGNKVFSAEELHTVTAPYENREISFDELESLRQALTLYYVNKGYINSGVIIPDQQVTDGTITLKVIEGSLTKISIEGSKHFRPGYFSDRIAHAAGPPVNVLRLQEILQILNQDSRIKRLNAELRPGLVQGESTLNVKVAENSPYKAALSFNNSVPPSIGDYRGEIWLSHRNLFGIGDSLEGSYGKAEGLDEYRVSYSVPINSYDTTVNIHFRKGDTSVIQEEFRGLDIKSKTDTLGLSVSHPFFRNPYRELWLSLAGEVRKSEMYLLGQGFSFSEGADEGKTRVSVLRFSQEWIDRGQKQVIAARSSFSMGIYTLNATHSDTQGPDGKFLSWLGQAKWVRRLTEQGLQLVFRTDMQFTKDPLLALEKFSVGGINSVRGYPENQLVRDNGVAGSLELRMPLYSSTTGRHTVHLVPFTDIGWSWNSKRDTPEPKSISGGGIGAIWNIVDRMNLQAYWGIPFRKFDRTSNALQEQGIHFQFVCGFL
jgi:hemolysin activation/secretion protein